MDSEAEQRALADVRSRLQQRFPDLDDGVVEAAVRVAHSELTGRVRDFVPVLSNAWHGTGCPPPTGLAPSLRRRRPQDRRAGTASRRSARAPERGEWVRVTNRRGGHSQRHPPVGRAAHDAPVDRGGGSMSSSTGDRSAGPSTWLTTQAAAQAAAIGWLGSLGHSGASVQPPTGQVAHVRHGHLGLGHGTRELRGAGHAHPGAGGPRGRRAQPRDGADPLHLRHVLGGGAGICRPVRPGPLHLRQRRQRQPRERRRHVRDHRRPGPDPDRGHPDRTRPPRDHPPVPAPPGRMPAGAPS